MYRRVAMTSDTDTSKKHELFAAIWSARTTLQWKLSTAHSIANTLRAIADALDPRCKDLKIVHARNNAFTTTHDPRLSAAHRTIQNKRHPVFFLPLDAAELAHSILTLEQELSELRQKLEDEKAKHPEPKVSYPLLNPAHRNKTRHDP